MEIDNDLVKLCLKQIEAKLNWGSGNNWTTKDFLVLGEKIFEETGVTLSVATLKRIWGKVSYSSKPTATTLDTLAQYLGFENWRTFQQESKVTDVSKNKFKTETESLSFGWSTLGKLLVFVSLLFLLGWKQFTIPEIPYEALDFDQFEFSSKKAITRGVPNSVIFDYNAQASDDRDTVFIQQSWNENLRAQVVKTDTKHSSIYYHPGYFKAKLVVRDTVVKEHDIFIKTDGWLPLIDKGKDVPIYFEEHEAIRNDGSFYISQDQIKAKNINMQPEVPWVNYYFMADLEDLTQRDFVFETRIKNTYKEGRGKCQMTKIELRFAGGVFLIPLSAKGCVGGLKMIDFDGEIKDLTKLGVDFSDWVDVKLHVTDGVGQLYVNKELIPNLGFNVFPLELKGVRFQFQGSGMIDEVAFKKPNGEVVLRETF